MEKLKNLPKTSEKEKRATLAKLNKNTKESIKALENWFKIARRPLK